MEFGILGPLEVRDGDRVVECRGVKQRTLLAVLLLNAGEVVSSDRLNEALWGEDAPPSARKALQMHVSQLRAALQPGRVPGASGEVIVTRPPGYELRLAPGQLDLERFERALADAAAARHACRWDAAAERLRDALGLWRGPPLADLANEEFLQPDIARLEELRLVATADRIEAELSLGRHTELVGELEDLVARHPLRERPPAQLMLALYRSGRQADALAVYAETRRRLVDELGLEPARELKELQARILAQDPALDAPEVATPPAPRPSAPIPADDGLIGREREMGELAALLDRALAGRGGTVLLAGEAGIGKSRLADAVADLARDRGARVLTGRCWESGGAPSYWPWVQVLRAALRRQEAGDLAADAGAGAADLATLVPELADLLGPLPPAAPADGREGRFRLFEAVAAFLARSAQREPVALFVDDLHAADAPSVLLLRYLAGQLAGSPLFLVVCYRHTDIGPEVADALAEMAREPSARSIRLGGLDATATRQLLEASMGRPPEPALLERVEAETRGNALHVAELGRLLAWTDWSAEQPLPVPAGLQEALGARLRRRSDRCRQVLGHASVLGREFSPVVLQRLAGISEAELLDVLEEATAAQLVEEVPGAVDRLRFAHVLIRDAAYGGLPAVRRPALHRAAAEALEAVHRADLEPHLAEVAHHYLLAGPASAQLAVDFSVRAGHRASSQLAFEEAARHYQAALEMFGPTHVGGRGLCELFLSLGDGLSLAGDGISAKTAFARAAEIAASDGTPQQLARAAIGYGGRFAWARAGSDTALVPLLEQALAAIGDADSPERAQLLSRLAAALRDEPRRERRAKLATEAVAIARRLGDDRILGRTLEGALPATEGPGDIDRRPIAADELVAIGRRLGDRERLYLGHELRLHAVWARGDRDSVDAELAALDHLAHAMRQPAHLWSLCTFHTALALMEGRLAEAETLIARARTMGERAQTWNAGVTHALATFVLRHAQGRAADVTTACALAVDRYPALWRFRCVLADLLAHAGRLDEARRLLGRLVEADLDQEYLDAEWIFAMCVLSDACATAGDPDAARRVYDVLAPYEGSYAEAPSEAPFGCVARALGVLAATAGRLDGAVCHLEAAIETEHRMRARPWEAHARHDLGAVLLRRDADGDRARAMDELRAARDTYLELGMDPWAERIDALGAARV